MLLLPAKLGGFIVIGCTIAGFLLYLLLWSSGGFLPGLHPGKSGNL
jgi:hypothetical protein